MKKEKVKKPEKETTAEDKKEIQVIERIIESKEIAPTDAFGKLSRPQIELIKRTIARGASDDELKIFIQVCKGANLNPFLKQVFLVPRWDSREGREVRAIQVSIDGFRSIAESSGAYAGNDDPIFAGEKVIKTGKEDLTVPEKATATVYKMIDAQRFAFTATARWSEYYPGAKMGFQWHIRPYLMLGKCAEALALRKAFPKLLSGMYAQEEMDQTAAVEPQAKAAKGFETILNIIRKASATELIECAEKMKKSDKYTKEQKDEFAKIMKERMEILNSEKKKETPAIPAKI